MSLPSPRPRRPGGTHASPLLAVEMVCSSAESTEAMKPDVAQAVTSPLRPWPRSVGPTHRSTAGACVEPSVLPVPPVLPHCPAHGTHCLGALQSTPSLCRTPPALRPCAFRHSDGHRTGRGMSPAPPSGVTRYRTVIRPHCECVGAVRRLPNTRTALAHGIATDTRHPHQTSDIAGQITLRLGRFRTIIYRR